MAMSCSCHGVKLIRSSILWLCALVYVEANTLKIGHCGSFTYSWGLPDGLQFFLALAYWNQGPGMLGDGGLRKPVGATPFNISVITLDSACSGRTAFENAMTAFADPATRPDVIVGCLCSAASLAVGRFSTAFQIPMLATASQSSLLSDKSQYPYLYRFCTTELTDADMHAGMLTYFNVSAITVIYFDSERAVKQKDRLMSLPAAQMVDALIVRLSDEDMRDQAAYNRVVQQARAAREGRSYIMIAYLSSDQPDNEELIMTGLNEAGLLNNYSIFLFPEVFYSDLSVTAAGDSALWGYVGSMLGQAKPITSRYQAWRDYAARLNFSSLQDVGFGNFSFAGTEPAGTVLDAAWVQQTVAGMRPWHTFRVEATIGLLTVLHQLREANMSITGQAIFDGIHSLSLQGIMGDLSWDANLNRQGLVYEILQLQFVDDDNLAMPEMRFIGDMVLTPGPDGFFNPTIDEAALSFQGSPPRKVLMYTEAPACDDGKSKPFPYALPSECEPCPAGTYSSADTNGLCLPCPAGLYGAAPGQSRCFSCQAGSYTATSASTACTLCTNGTFVDTPGAMHCKACPAGKFAEQHGASGCDWCPLGTYQSHEGAAECESCSVHMYGSITTARGSESAADCLCDMGTYFSNGSQPRCEVCHAHSNHTSRGAQSPESCLCDGGYMLLRSASGAPRCASCPSWLVCPGGNGPPLQAEGFRTGPAEDGALPTRVIGCTRKDNCPAGLPLDSCPGNRDDKACDSCVKGYYENDDYDCVSCDEPASKWPIVIFLLLCIPLVGGLVYHGIREHSVQRQTLMTILISCGLVLYALQCLGAFSDLSLQWVEPMKSLATALRFFVLDIDVFSPGCVVDLKSPERVYALSLLVYPAGASMVLLGFAVMRFAVKLPVSRDRVFNTQGLLMLVCYLSLVVNCMKPWQCQKNPDGTSSMLTQRSIICFESNVHQVMIACSVIGLLVYGVGFMSLVAWAVLKFPIYVTQHGGIEFLHRFDFLFRRFHPGKYYYAMVFNLRNLLIAIVPVPLVNHPPAQLMTMAFLFGGFGMLEAFLKPWHVEIANYLAGAFNFALILILFSGCMLVDVDFDETSGFLQIFLMVVLTFMLATSVATIAFFAYRSVFPPRTYGIFLCHHKLGAGVLARMFKIVMAEQVHDQIFVDSDFLDNLDGLFNIVATEVNNLVVIWTRETLNRMWCAGEITTAVQEGVHIVPVACDDYEKLSDKYVDSLEDVWNDEEKVQLCALGIYVSDIQAAYRTYRDMETYDFSRAALPHEQEYRIQDILGACDGLHKKATLRTAGTTNVTGSDGLPGKTPRSAKATSKLKDVVMLGDLSDPEALCTCQVLRHLLQGLLQKSVAIITDPLPEDISQVTHLVVVLSRGVLGSQKFAATLLPIQRAGISTVLVNGDPAFTFPTPTFWDALSKGLIVNLKDPELQGISAEDITSSYQSLFKDIAKKFSAQSSQRILEAEASDMVRLFNERKRAINPVPTSPTDSGTGKQARRPSSEATPPTLSVIDDQSNLTPPSDATPPTDSVTDQVLEPATPTTAPVPPAAIGRPRVPVSEAGPLLIL